MFYRNARAKSDLDLCVSSLGIHERMEPGVIRHGGPEYPFLFMFFHDQAWLSPGLDTQQDALRGLIVWEPDAAHHYGNPERSWDHSWMIAQGGAIARAVDEHGLPLNTLLLVDVEDIFVRYLTMIHCELRTHGHGDGYVLRGLLGLWVHELARASRSDRAPIPRNIRAAEDYMHRNLSDPVALEDVAGAASLSVPRFIARFKEFYGVPPIRFLINTRLERAAQLLAYKHLSIKEIARKVGFADQLYFTRQFKAHFGMPPRAFRARL